MCPQEVASKAGESGSDPGVDQEGAAAGGDPGLLHRPRGPAHTPQHLPVGHSPNLTPGTFTLVSIGWSELKMKRDWWMRHGSWTYVGCDWLVRVGRIIGSLDCLLQYCGSEMCFGV